MWHKHDKIMQLEHTVPLQDKMVICTMYTKMSYRAAHHHSITEEAHNPYCFWKYNRIFGSIVQKEHGQYVAYACDNTGWYSNIFLDLSKGWFDLHL